MSLRALAVSSCVCVKQTGPAFLFCGVLFSGLAVTIALA